MKAAAPIATPVSRLGMQLGQHLVAPTNHPSSVILSAMRGVTPTITALGEIGTEIPGLRV